MTRKKDSSKALNDRADAVLMLNKEERILIKSVLSMTLNSQNGKAFIQKKIGPEYIKIAEELLKTLDHDI